MRINGPGPQDATEEIKAALDEYKEVQQEKRLYIQSSFAVLTLVVVGSVGVLSAMVQTRSDEPRLAIALAAQFGQLSLILVAQILSAFSLRHAMYAAVIEERISRLVGRRIIRWEVTTAERYPGRSLRNGEKSDISKGWRDRLTSLIDFIIKPREWPRWIRSLWPPGIIERYLLLLGALAAMLLAGEIFGTELLIYKIVDSVLWKVAAMMGYLAIMVLLMTLLGLAAAAQPDWSKRLLNEFRNEEDVSMGLPRNEVV